MNVEKIKELLAEHDAQKQSQGAGNQKTDNLFWKPNWGTQKVRIVPSPHNPDYPGTELYFYYEFGKPMLAPSTFGLPDPIVKFCNTLKAEKGDKETVSKNWKIANKLSPKKRVYVPVIVRGVDGKPDTGPFYWGIAPTHYEEILKLFVDEDYGDITDYERGRDLTVEYTKPKTDGGYPDTSIRPRGNSSVMTEDTEMFERIKSLKDIREVYKCPTEEQLNEALLNYIKAAPAASPEPSATSTPTPDIVDLKNEFSAKFNEVFKEDGGDDLPF